MKTNALPKSKGSVLERKFDLYWRGVNGPVLTPEHKWHPTRKWRFDFANTVGKVAIEVEGGTWGGGRHTRGGGYEADCEKYNEAQLAGWIVFRLTGSMIQVPTLERIAAFVRARACQLADPYAVPTGTR